MSFNQNNTDNRILLEDETPTVVVTKGMVSSHRTVASIFAKMLLALPLRGYASQDAGQAGGRKICQRGWKSPDRVTSIKSPVRYAHRPLYKRALLHIY